MDKKEYIERGALIEMIEGHTSDTWGNGINRAWWSHAVMVKDNFVRMLKKAPSADVVEVRHGEWKQATEPCGWHDVDCVVCSACGESWILDGDFDFDVVKDFWNFCPNCGAKMDGERKEQT